MGWIISPVHAAGPSPAHSIWAGLGPAHNGWARSGPVFFKKIQKYFLESYNFPCIFYVILINIKQYFYVAKNTTFGIKIPGFRQKKNMFLFSCIRPNLSKLKNSYYIFIQQRKLKKKCFIMHFDFNNQFIKVTRI